MAFLKKLFYLNLNDKTIENNQQNDMIKQFIDSLFGDNALEIIKFKHPLLNDNLNKLAAYYEQLDLDSSFDDLDVKLEVAKLTIKLTNLDKEREELKEMEDNLKELSEAKKRLSFKKEHLNRLMKKGDVIDNLKSDVEKVKDEFKDRYNNAKATEKILENIGYRMTLSAESMNKLKEDIAHFESKVQKLEEFTQLFEGIDSEDDLKLKINFLNEELKNYKDFFIKTEEEN